MHDMQSAAGRLGKAQKRGDRRIPDQTFVGGDRLGVGNVLEGEEREGDAGVLVGPGLVDLRYAGVAQPSERLGLALDRETVKGVEDANDAMVMLKSAVQGIARSLAVALSPAIITAVTLSG